jgi:hypothetical protein
MIDLEKDLKTFKFSRKGTIDLEKGKTYPVFKGIAKEKEEGNVYMSCILVKRVQQFFNAV